MGYTSKRGRRPNEYASKSAHGHVIQDADVQDFLTQCNLPKKAEDVDLAAHLTVAYTPVADNPIQHVIAVDGGYSEVVVQKEFPSAKMCFFQFGALVFSVSDLEQLEVQPFIDPDDIAKLKRIQRMKLILPVKNISLKSEGSLTKSVRKAVFNFFCKAMDDGRLIETLRWFLYEEYAGGVATWVLASCPNCGERSVPLDRTAIRKDHTVPCPKCQASLYLTDVFRFHEVVDDELGAGEIPGYLTTTIEQMILVHLIRTVLRTKPGLLEEILFIKDGPLAFFGQTANMQQPMRAFVKFLFEKHNLYLAGLEKSGAFVEHADEIAGLLDDGTALLLDDKYIYQYILPSKGDSSKPYGASTYYGNKLVFKTKTRQVYVITVPTTASNTKPTENDLPNLQAILTNIEKLRCDMYDSALIPVALVNKLVSLANHPSSRILQKFAKDTLGG